MAADSDDTQCDRRAVHERTNSRARATRLDPVVDFALCARAAELSTLRRSGALRCLPPRAPSHPVYRQCELWARRKVVDMAASVSARSRHRLCAGWTRRWLA